MTPGTIQQMQDYLYTRAEISIVTIPTSLDYMTRNIAEAYSDVGLHVVESVADAKANLLFNLRCNADASRTWYPFSRTCCNSYPTRSHTQELITYVLGPLLFAPIKSVKNFRQLIYKIPASKVWIALMYLSYLLSWCYTSDRTHHLDKVNKHFHPWQFQSACVLFGLAAVLSFRCVSQAPKDEDDEKSTSLTSSGLDASLDTTVPLHRSLESPMGV
jgi:hypothetical protein